MTNKSPKKLLPSPPDHHTRSDFDFQQKIGDGAYGQVWKARHKKTFNIFAIKQVQKSKVKRILPQFQREVQILYSTKHPHILKLFSHFEDEKFFYLLTEFVEGGNLFNKLSRESTLLERVAAQYFREIVLAVEYLHTRDPIIIHRDIKPENILIDKNGRVKLADFGWANFVFKANERLTSCGTLEYLPPEMVDEKGHDTSADIWCLGVLLFEMLAGSTPFRANGNEKTMKNILTGSVKFPLGFSHIAKDLVLKMLEKENSKRIDIFEVKNHRWLTINLPIRETVIQNFPPKILLPVFCEKTDEVVTANSDNDSDEEIKVTENAFRKSLKKFKKDLSSFSKQVADKRSSLQENCREYFNLCLKEKDLEAKVEEKSKAIMQVVGSNKELLAKCFDLNLDLERLQSQDWLVAAEKKKSAQNKLGELKKEIQLKRIFLGNIKARIKNSSQSYAESEKTLKVLSKQLQDVKDSIKNSKEKQKSGIYELASNLDMLKSQIKEKDKFSCKFSQTEKIVAKDISDMIREKNDVCKDFNREFYRKLEEIEEGINEKEQEISELCIEYEMKKSQKLHFLRKCKDDFLRKSRREREENRICNAKKNEELRLELKSKLNEARKIECYVESIQIDQGYKKIDVGFI